jgi:hypothetical protein
MVTRRPTTRGWLALVVLGTLASSHASAQAPSPTEYQVQAAYLSHFGSFVEWPAPRRSQSTFTLCVLGADPFGPVLESAVSDRTVDGRPMMARRISQPRDAESCHILFISASEEPRLDRILGDLADSSTLTVSNMPRFTVRGGMLQFVVVGNNVRFEINETRALGASLVLSSQLLRLAVAVRRGDD